MSSERTKHSNCVGLSTEDCYLAQGCSWAKQSSNGRKAHCRKTTSGAGAALGEWRQFFDQYRAENPHLEYRQAQTSASTEWHRQRGTTKGRPQKQSQGSGRDWMENPLFGPQQQGGKLSIEDEALIKKHNIKAKTKRALQQWKPGSLAEKVFLESEYLQPHKLGPDQIFNWGDIAALDEFKRQRGRGRRQTGGGNKYDDLATTLVNRFAQNSDRRTKQLFTKQIAAKLKYYLEPELRSMSNIPIEELTPDGLDENLPLYEIGTYVLELVKYGNGHGYDYDDDLKETRAIIVDAVHDMIHESA